jgi:hypothetical protein
MMEKERKVRIPVEVDDDGFMINEDRLDESLHRRIDELANEKVAKSSTHLRTTLAALLSLFVLGMIVILALRGAVILSFILILAVLFNAGGVAAWIEGKKDEG